jgi:hypothetical protein
VISAHFLPGGQCDPERAGDLQLAQGIELGRIRPQPVMPLAHVLMGAGDEAALYVAEAADRTRARAEMIGILDQLIQGLTA